MSALSPWHTNTVSKVTVGDNTIKCVSTMLSQPLALDKVSVYVPVWVWKLPANRRLSPSHISVVSNWLRIGSSCK